MGLLDTYVKLQGLRQQQEQQQLQQVHSLLYLADAAQKIKSMQQEEQANQALANVSPDIINERITSGITNTPEGYDVADPTSMITERTPKPDEQYYGEAFEAVKPISMKHALPFLMAMRGAVKERETEERKRSENPLVPFEINGTKGTAALSNVLPLYREQNKESKAPTVHPFIEGESHVDKQWDPDKKQWVEVSRGPRHKPTTTIGGASGQVPLTEDAVSQEGAKYLLTGKLPFTGMGGAGRKEMINKAAEIAKTNNWTPNDILRMQADYKGMDGSMKNQRKIYDMMTGFVINMDKQMERLDAIYQKLPRSQYKLLNIPFVKLRTMAEGSGEEASAAALLIELGNESGKLSTNSASSIRELSESAQKQWARVHDQTLSYTELKKVLETTKRLGHDRLNSTKAAMDFTLQGIQALGSANQPQNPAITPPAQAGSSWEALKKKKGW
jgi:hypothetical protein